MKMTLRPLLLTVVVLALAAKQPSLAKEAHGQHGSRASAANATVNAKSANPAASKANGAMNAESTIAPPVLPSQGATRPATRTLNPNVKIIPPGNAAHGQAAGTTAPAVRNAIGQPIVAPKNFVGSEARVSPGLQASGPAPGAGPPTGLHGAPVVAPPVLSSSPARVSAPPANLAKAANRGSVNGAALIRPATAPTAIGGAVRSNYGINGTTVQNKH